MTAIAEAMAAIQSDVQSVPKAERNKQQGYNFRGIAQVVEMMHPILVKHHVLMLPTIENQSRSEFTTKNGSVMSVCVLTIRWDFVAEDGSTLSISTVGEGADSMDKATNKAMTAAQKYALTLAFSIPFSDQPDGDADSPGDRTPRKRRAAGAKITKPQQARLWAIAGEAGKRLDAPKERVEGYVRRWCHGLGIETTADLAREPWEKLCDRLEALTLDQLDASESGSAGGEPL